MKNELVADEAKPRIEVGKYDAVCISAEYSNIGFGLVTKLYLNFAIVNHEKYNGIVLFMACNKPKGKLTYRFKLYTQWSIAIGRVPYKGERFNKNLFLKKLYRINVVYTKRKDDDGEFLPDFLQHSVVKSIIEPLTGKGSIK